LVVLAKYPASLELDIDQLTMIFYSCAQEERNEVFQVFPAVDVNLRAATVYTRANQSGTHDDFCLTVLLQPEEEPSAYQEVLMNVLKRVTKVNGDPPNRRRRYRQILADAFRKIKRRGGFRDQSLCPYTYERPVDDDEIASYCRVVKKTCYLTIYQMAGYPQCPRYIRRQRQTQLANARKILRAGIQRILEESDSERRKPGKRNGAWTDPIHAILDQLFSVLNVTNDTTELAHHFVDQIQKGGRFQGHPRPIIAASIAYLAAKETGNSIPENDIIELIGCSRTSLRRNCRELRRYFAQSEETTRKPRRKTRQPRTKLKVRNPD
jgi:hypothetical protein